MDLWITQQKMEGVTVLALFLESLIVETLSPDVIELAAMRTKTRAGEMGIPPDFSEMIVKKMVEFARAKQVQHPLASLF